MHASIGTGRGRGASRELDLSTLPLEHVDKAHRAGGCFLLVFSLFWGGMPTLILIGSLLGGKFEPAMLFVLIFTLIGAGLFILGLKLATTRRVIRFAADRVSLDERSIFGHNTWSEPMSEFPGVRSRSEHHSGGKNSSSYTLHIVELYHPDKRKRIRLYESRQESGLRQRHETYCRQLNLPAIEGDDHDLISRAVEDLDKSVRELAREGKLAVDFDPSRTPPTGIVLRPEGDRLRIELPHARFSFVGALIAMLVPGFFIGIGFGLPDAPVFFGIIGIVFLLIFALAIGWSVLARTVLIVSPASVHVLHRLPWGETKGRIATSDHIESVRIGRTVENRGQPGVLLVTDDGTETIGQGQRQEVLEWLRGCILAVVTKG